MSPMGSRVANQLNQLVKLSMKVVECLEGGASLGVGLETLELSPLLSCFHIATADAVWWVGVLPLPGWKIFLNCKPE